MMSHHLSPLRYPGGKGKLAPFILDLLIENRLVGGHYVEPYAGGAGIAISLLLGNHVSHIHLNDSNGALYAFWRSVLNHTEELCRLIARASLNMDEWRRQKEILASPRKYCQLDVGYSLLYLNRCNRSGILGGGVIGGLQQNGKWKMDARFPRNELIKRIEAIASRRASVTVKNWDAERFIVEYVSKLPKQTLVYCDPPYFHKGSRLYLNHYSATDHCRIAKTIQSKLRHRWLVSYDFAEPIKACYPKRRSFLYQVQYNVQQAYTGTEMFFFSDNLVLPVNSSNSTIDLALKTLTA